MAIQIEEREHLRSSQHGLLLEGYELKEHQHDGLLYIKTEGGYLYQAVMDMNGLVRRYKPQKQRLALREINN